MKQIIHKLPRIGSVVGAITASGLLCLHGFLAELRLRRRCRHARRLMRALQRAKDDAIRAMQARDLEAFEMAEASFWALSAELNYEWSQI